MGIGTESLRNWARQAEIDRGVRGGTTTEDKQRIVQLERGEPSGLRRANEILKSASAFFARLARGAVSTMSKYIDAHRERFGVEPICSALQVAPSTYYAASTRPPSPRSRSDVLLKPELLRVHAANYGVYGVRKLWRQLAP